MVIQRFRSHDLYYFKDINNNLKFDKKVENIHGEFVHTTPDNEAQSFLGKIVELAYSHGCIHVRPDDIDEMIQKGYLSKGNLLVVHSYSQKVPQTPKKSGKRLFEFHFYPYSNKIVIFGNSNKR